MTVILCPSCERPTRAPGTPIEEAPGTIIRKRVNGLCVTCVKGHKPRNSGPRTCPTCHVTTVPQKVAKKHGGIPRYRRDGTCRGCYERSKYWADRQPPSVPELWEGPLPTGWPELGSCVGRGDVMFPYPNDKEGVRAARAICAGCPVKRICFTYAIRSRPSDGVWGGFLARELKGGAL